MKEGINPVESPVDTIKEILKNNSHCEIYYILDDNKQSLESIKISLESILETPSKTFLIISHQNSQSIIDEYKQINKEITSEQSSKTRQFFLLDGELGTNDNYFGASVAYSIVRIAIENQFKIPYFFGFSGADNLNDKIRTYINFALENQEPNGNKWYNNLSTKERQNIDDLIKKRESIETKNNSYYLGKTHNKNPIYIMPIIKQIISS